jgi:hypothetical protein
MCGFIKTSFSGKLSGFFVLFGLSDLRGIGGLFGFGF